MICKVNTTWMLAPWCQILMPHLLHFLLDLCMHHCKLGCILHLSCAEATHGLQDAMSAGQCSRRARAQSEGTKSKSLGSQLT